MLDSPLTQFDIKPLEEGEVGLAVLGFPISHSISPQLHQAALSEMALLNSTFLHWKYHKIELAVEHLEETLPVLAHSGYRGLNLTIPHKVKVLNFLNKIDPVAQKMGAVNTLNWENGGWKGYNTDGIGLSRAVRQAFSLNLGEFEVLVLGAGGAARAAICQSLTEGCSKIALINRSPERALQLIECVAPSGNQGLVRLINEDEIPRFFSKDKNLLIINATSVGLKKEDLPPIDMGLFSGHVFLYDMVYNPPQTQLIRDARSRGYLAVNGMGMLVGQAARSLEIWSGEKVSFSAMENAALQTLPL